MIKKTFISLLVLVLVFPCLSVLTACSESSADANLLGLSVTAAGGNVNLDTPFNPNMYNYLVNIGYQPTKSVVVVANPTKPYGTKFANNNITSVTLSKDNLVDSIYITVIAANGRTKKTYEITVKMADPSSNADLSFLKLDGMEPSFEASRTEYKLTVPFQPQAQGPFTVTASPTKTPTSTFAPDNVTSVSVSENSPKAKIVIKVIAQDGKTSKTYTVDVEMQEVSKNNRIERLTVSFGTLVPSFHPDTTVYNINIPFQSSGNRTVTANPVLSDGAVLDESGTLGTVLTTNVSATKRTGVIRIKVLAQDNKTSRTYTINVSMTPDTNSRIQNMSFSVYDEGGLPVYYQLNPVTFNPNITNYSLTVPWQLSGAIYVTAIPNPSETVTIDETSDLSVMITSGTAVLYIEVVAVAQSGARTTYTIAVSMQADASAANLETLTVDRGSLSPSFNSIITVYNVSIPYLLVGATTVTATAKAVKGASIQSSSVLSVTVSNTDPQKQITINVNSDGGTIQSYIIIVTMEPNNSNAYLERIDLNGSDNSFSPTFSPTTYSYILRTYMTSTITAVPATASGATIDNAASKLTASVSSSNKEDEIKIVVVASDGVTRTEYIIHVAYEG